ncbi:MAG: hypothetical protein ACOC2O_00945 [Bacillota bacterium]
MAESKEKELLKSINEELKKLNQKTDQNHEKLISDLEESKARITGIEKRFSIFSKIFYLAVIPIVGATIIFFVAIQIMFF